MKYGTIPLEVPDRDTKIEEMQVGEETDLSLPILVGSILAVFVLTLLTLVIVRKKYDVEKAEGSREESEKLNEQNDEQLSSINE